MHKGDQKKDILAKVLIIGEAKVGKTSILTRYTEGQFQENMIPTLGIDYRIKRLQVKGHDIKLQIWDTAGQERFRAITQNFYKGAMGIILVFDLTDPRSFKTLSNWIENIRQFSGVDACRLLLGNKQDLAQNQIPRHEIENLAKEFNIQYFETSAKNNSGIEQAFQTITEEIVNKFFPDIANNNTDSRLQQQQNNDLDGSIIKSPDEIKRQQQQQQQFQSENLHLSSTKSPKTKQESDSCCS